jgi:TonB family protein
MRTASIFEELEGRTVDGEFPLLERLGGSADSGVFLTVRRGVQRSVIKLTRAEGVDVDAFRAHWEVAKNLSHPHLLKVHEAGRRSIDGIDLLYVVTEPADEVLSHVIEERALDPAEARETLTSILDALNFLHAKDFVHGHVKPSNIMLVSNSIKLSADDFIVAGLVRKHIKKPGDYDAPEVLTGSLTSAADIWSVGISLTEMLTQHLPKLDWQANGKPIVPDSLPQPFYDIVADCLQLEPHQRCTIRDIRAFLARDPAPAPAPAPAIDAAPAATAPAASEPAPAKPASAQASANPKPATPEPKSVEWPKAPDPSEAETKIEPQPEPVAPRFNSFTAKPRKIEPLNFESEPRILEADGAPVTELFRSTRPEPAEPPARERVGPMQPDNPRPTSKWEEVQSAPLPELFSGYEEPEPRRFHIMPILLGLLVLLGFASVLLVRSGKIDIPWLDTLEEVPIAKSAPQPQQQPSSPLPNATETAPDAQSQQPATPSDTQATQSDTQATPAPQQSAPSSENSDASQTNESGDETPTPAATQPATNTAPTQPKLAPKPASPAPISGPANVEAAVVKQVMPGVAPGAREGMRGPVQVTVSVDVDSKGNVTDAYYITPGEGNYFARIAHRAAQQWKFRPPAHNGRPEASGWTLQFNFTRAKVDVTATLDEQ